MKKVILVLGVLAIALVVFNLFHIDFSDPFQGDSYVALVGVTAGLCAVVLLALLWVAKKIQERINR
jgi:hypothetical protein